MSKELIKSRHSRTKSLVALVLSFAAGFVDVVGVLTIYQLFTAHMTGTTVRLGQQLVYRNWSEVAPAATILAAFFAASLVGRILIEIGQRSHFRRIASLTLSMEAVLLAGVIPIGTYSPHVAAKSLPLICLLLAMLAGAMGLQTASLTRIGALTVHTTFVTGMVNKLAQVSSRWLFGIYDLHSKSDAADERLRGAIKDHARQSRFFFSIWLLYLVGATFGTWLGTAHELTALWVPFSILLAVIIVDLVHPLSIEEEREQVE